jgi:hypothetical protein
MRVRFQADADLNRHIIAAVKRREPLVDFQTAPEAGLMGLDDQTVLALASKRGTPSGFARSADHAASLRSVHCATNKPRIINRLPALAGLTGSGRATLDLGRFRSWGMDQSNQFPAFVTALRMDRTTPAEDDSLV